MRGGDCAAWLALLASLAFGSSDFVAGLASRKFPSGSVTGVTQAVGLLVAVAAVVVVPGVGPTASAQCWGAISGVGGALGLLSLFHGLAVARMSVVATVSAVLTVVIPVVLLLNCTRVHVREHMKPPE